MQNSSLLADYLRSFARWRLDRAEPDGEERDVRAALALLDAAAYVRSLSDADRTLLRLRAAGCFFHGRYNPGEEGEALIRRWHHGAADGGPEELLALLASAAERGLAPARRAPRQVRAST